MSERVHLCGGIADYLRATTDPDDDWPNHARGHVWSWLTDYDGARQCLVDGCYASRLADGTVVEMGEDDEDDD